MRFTKSKLIVFSGIITFLVMSFWGLYSMPMDEHGKMADCPFMNDSASLCQMSVTEHIARWQQLFTAIPEKNLLFSALILLTALLMVLFSIVPKIRDKLLFQRFLHYFYRRKPEINLFNHLLLAFSQGILNPRIYA